MRQPAIADAGTAAPEAASHGAQVPMAERLALGVEEAQPAGLSMRPGNAGQPCSTKSGNKKRGEQSACY
jgi:hypothetical protein